MRKWTHLHSLTALKFMSFDNRLQALYTRLTHTFKVKSSLDLIRMENLKWVSAKASNTSRNLQRGLLFRTESCATQWTFVWQVYARWHVWVDLQFLRKMCRLCLLISTPQVNFGKLDANIGAESIWEVGLVGPHPGWLIAYKRREDLKAPHILIHRLTGERIVKPRILQCSGGCWSPGGH